MNFIKIDHSPDSNFPNGIPNPMLKENHIKNKEHVIKNNADLSSKISGIEQADKKSGGSGAFLIKLKRL